MSDSTVESSVREFFRNKLKAVDVATLEKAIAEAFGKLASENFECSIKNIEYGVDYTPHGAKMSITLSVPLGSLSSKKEES